MDAQVVAIKHEQDAFRDIKAALDRIAEAEDDILNDWVIVGERLLELRGTFPTWNGTYRAECRMHNIVLTGNERSAAMWWASLTAEQRDTLRHEFPDRLAPTALQNGCRETRPEWAKRANSEASHSVGSQKTRSKPSEMVSPSDDVDQIRPDTANVRLSKADKKEILERLKQEELERHREARYQERERKQKAEAKRAAEDRRPRLTPQKFEVMMFGVRMWPDPDRLKLGDYDYDQLFFAIHQFWAWWKFVPENLDHESRAIHLRTHIGPLLKFVERRLEPGFCQTEMVNFIRIFQRLADLYLENPEGENKLPHDHVLSNG